MASSDTPESLDSDIFGGHHDSGDLTPLPRSVRDGLIAISVLAFLSFIAATLLFSYLSYRLVTWRMVRASRAERVAKNMPEPPIGVEFTAEDRAFGPQGQDSKAAHLHNMQRVEQSKNSHPNQFLVLVLNLFLADMHQGASFLLSHTWLQKGGIFVSSPTCFAQGFFDSNGDLSSSCFITAIAIHTFLSVVKGWRPPAKALYLGIAGIWVLVYGLSVIPLLVTHNGRDFGGYFVRAGPWCWINEAKGELRFFTHYMFIFIALITTTTLYVSIFISLRRQARAKAAQCGQGNVPITLSHNPTFLLYPVIYVLCTLPLAVGRIATMAGANVPPGYYCFAGALIASNGWCDCLLFGTTRHTIIFGSQEDVDAANTGLDTFAFMRTPAGKRFGNTIWIQGGDERPPHAYGVGGWWQRLGHGVVAGRGVSGGSATSRSSKGLRERTTSQESLRSAGRKDAGIQMDVITSVAVEVDSMNGQEIRSPGPVVSKNPSMGDGEGDYGKPY